MPTKRKLRSTAKRRSRRFSWYERPVSREDWEQYRESLMRECRLGERPEEWWLFERGEERPEHQAQRLWELGELGPAELPDVISEWRERWAKAQKPRFAYCIGHAKEGDTFASWLEGAEARKAHYRFWDIPAKLVEQWNAERRAAAKLKRGKMER
jgi:hypothetical protein